MSIFFVGNVMNEVECVIGGGGRGDLNSNHAGLASANTTSSSVDRNTASCVSNASSQDIGDFVQDNSDYQWFLDYGYGAIDFSLDMLTLLKKNLNKYMEHSLFCILLINLGYKHQFRCNFLQYVCNFFLFFNIQPFLNIFKTVLKSYFLC